MSTKFGRHRQRIHELSRGQTHRKTHPHTHGWP